MRWKSIAAHVGEAMKFRKLMCLAALTLFAAVPTALAGGKWYVDGVNGSDHNNCESTHAACKTIGHAISLASKGDFISFAAATYTENLTIPFSLEIVGSSAVTTIIDAGGVASGILISLPKAQVILSRLTVRNGGGKGDGGGIYNCFPTLTIIDSIISGNRARKGDGSVGFGGAIYNCPGSTLTVTDTTFSDNSAEQGGAICNGGTLTINNSTFTGNRALRLKGGAIRNYGTLTINNSTFTGNSASGGIGGAINNGEAFRQKGTLLINNSTLSGNTAADGKGGGIFNPDGILAIIQNSIVADNSGGDCFGSMNSNGYNLSSDSTCNFNSAGDLNNTEPALGPLQNNGGPTETRAELHRSPTIDAGNPSGCTDSQGHLLKTDQRGEPRPGKYKHDHRCDMGAYERQHD
jgi:predicted outer membrane repeat protein